jgi:hypothetical protein
MLYIMFRGSWDITSHLIVKNLRREVVAAPPIPKVTLHHKWMKTSISFDASDCPKSMARVRQLPLLVSPTIVNIKLYHVLIDGGTSLNLISMAAFKNLQILMSKLQSSRPFSGVGLVPVIPRSCIPLPITFGMPENFCTKGILFDVTEVSLPFNAILGRLALYQFIAVAHYGYQVLKMSSSNSVLKIRGDHDADVSTLEKLQAFVAQHEVAAGPGSPNQEPSSSRQRGSSSTPCVQPSGKMDILVKTIQIRADAAQTTRIAGIWTTNRNSYSSPSSRLM